MYAHDMFCFNALLIYEITLEIKSMVHLKRIACLAEAVAQIVNEWDNPFLFRCMWSVECWEPVTESRIVLKNFVAPADMQNSLKLSGSYTVSALLNTMSS